MNVRIRPNRLQGILPAPPAKAHAHRLLICAALADKPTLVQRPGKSQDVLATLDCLAALGAGVEWRGEDVRITPMARPAQAPLLDCRESGSTLRFLLPVAAAVADSPAFTGRGRLPQRPIGHLAEAMALHGAVCSAPGLPLTVRGRLAAGHYALPGDVSSQYITGLLLALPRLEGDSTLQLTTALSSAPYIRITLSVLKAFGVRVETDDALPGWRIPGGQTFRSPGTAAVEGDWSNAAFWLAAAALGSDVALTGLEADSPQGDKAVVELLAGYGAQVRSEGGSLLLRPGTMQGQCIDVSQVPDLLPILAVAATGARGETRFVNAARLRLKESDRLATTAQLINGLGGCARELPDGLTVTGSPLTGGTVDSCGDHRIAMAAAIAATRCACPVVITGADAVEKSYPAFFADYASLGGEFDEL